MNINTLSKTSFLLHNTTPMKDTNGYSYCKYKGLHRKVHPAEQITLKYFLAI